MGRLDLRDVHRDEDDDSADDPVSCECGCGSPAAIAEKTDNERGWKKGQPKRFANATCAHRFVGRATIGRNQKTGADHHAAWHGPLVDASETEIAWAAGFFDGEGCATISHNDRYATLYLHVSQKDIRPLERFLGIMGAGRIQNPDKRSGVSRWATYGRAGWAVIDRLWPYLGEPKREQIERVRELLAVEHPLRSGAARDESLPLTAVVFDDDGDSWPDALHSEVRSYGI